MELSSMLAGEPFSDRPRCVDPVLAAYLRAFNDRLGHHDRQRLYPYAALAVNTHGDRARTRARRDRCLAFAGATPGLTARIRLLLRVGLRAAVRLTPASGEWAAREVLARADIDAGFRLLDALVGADPAPWPSERVEAALPAMRRTVEAADDAGAPVIYVNDTFDAWR